MLRDNVLRLCGITKHQYYKRNKEINKAGRRPSETTPKINEAGNGIEVINNEEVVNQIAAIKSNPETDYGYRAMTAALMLLGYLINHKKVYRLMAAYQLLHPKRRFTGKTFAKYGRVVPTQPLEVLEMDIKYQWVNEHFRYGFILTILDCFTRKALYWTVGYSIKKEQVKLAWEYIIVHYLQPYDRLKDGITVEVRTDNDPRFAAQVIQQYFKDNHLDQVFTHPYTPQENGHVESFHSILSRSLDKKQYGTIIDLEKHLQNFYKVYNQIRLHGSLDHLPPDSFWRLWNDGLIHSIEKKNKKQCFQLKIPHYLLSGNGSPREVSSSLAERLKEVTGADTLQQPSVQRSPSVVSSKNKISNLEKIFY